MTATPPDPGTPDPETSDPQVEVAELLEAALAALGEHQGSVVVDEATSANLRWADNSLTTNGEMHDRRLTVIAHVEVAGGTAVGIAAGPLTGAADVADLVPRAIAAAHSSSPAEDAVALVPGEPAEDWQQPAADGGIDAFAGLAGDLGSQLARAREAGVRWFGFAEHVVTTTWLGTSTGVRRRSVDRMGRIEINAKRDAQPDDVQPDDVQPGGARSGTGSVPAASVWVGQSYAELAEVDVTALAADLDQRLAWSRTSVALPAGRYETLLPPSAVADFLIYAYWTMSRRDAEQGRNVYAAGEGRTRIGERLSSLPLTVSSDPAAPGMTGPEHAVVRAPDSGLTSVFDNGAPVGRVDWLTDGVLEALIAPRVPDRDRLWFPTENLLADAGGTATLAEMIAGTERGLLLTCLWYMREVDPETLLLTGLTRDGVYLIEHGEVVGQVNNFRFNESPVDLLRRASEASVSERTLCREWNDWFTRTTVPALRIPDFNMSTVSQAS